MAPRARYQRFSCLALVAICLFVACENRPDGRPRARNSPSTVAQQLGQRPLEVPTRSADEPCFLERYAVHLPGVPAEAGLGRGPVHPVFRAVPRILDLFSTDERSSPRTWPSAEVLFVSEPDYHGPVLIRGRQMDGQGELAFGDRPTPAPELFLPQGGWNSARNRKVWDGRRLNLPEGWRVELATIRIGANGCYALQLDGTSFSQVIKFEAVLQPDPL